MPLRVLDGNQTATTLSSVVTGGEHIVAHTVVSLGSTAISNIASAVSGSVVSISNFPSTQTIAGTVTANGGDFVAQYGAQIPSKLVVVGGYDLPNDQILPIPLIDGGGRVLAEITGTVTARLQDASGNNLTSTSIGGVQRLNVSLASAATPGGTLPTFVNVYGGSDSGTVRALAVDSSGRTVVTGNANVLNSVTVGAILDPSNQNIIQQGGGIRSVLRVRDSGGTYGDLQGSGINTFNLPVYGTVTIGNSVTVSALPSGALTTRFGSVTTANTAQITSAVTNTSRKYLLAQNISAGTVTIGIGFSPTTTQGIQLTAGGGLTFDAFCPTGAVYWLGAVTGAAFTILEG